MARRLLRVGDVVKSPKFAFGRKEFRSPLITIDGKTTSYPVIQSIPEEKRIKTAARIGKILPKEKVVDYGRFDKSRGEAEFVVEKAVMDGGGTGMGPHDVFPDGWHITARRLNKKGKFDPKGEQIQFYMTGSFDCMVNKKDIEIVRQMQLTFK